MPLRRRLTISYVGFFAVALIILGSGLYLIVRQSLYSAIDDELERGVDLLQEGFNASNQSPRTYFNGEQLVLLLKRPPVREFEASNLYIQVYDLENSNRLVDSPNLTPPVEASLATLEQARASTIEPHTAEMAGARMREMLQPLIFKGQPVAVIQVARSLSETDRALRLLLYVLLGGGAVVLLAVARGGAWLTRAAFQPIDEITRTAQSIVRAEDLSLRVPVPPANDELQALSITVNDLLGRLEALFGAQRRFVADVSHELRTPLAAMQGNLEVLDRGAARDPELLAESLADMRREVGRLIRMANDLLLLAQSEAGIRLRCEPVELDTLLLEVHRELRPLAEGVQLRIGEEDQVVVRGDRDRVKQALLNLGINALQHTPAGGSVTLSLGLQEGMAALSVTDTGSGISPADLPYIFERFYRIDRSRSRNRGGAGLGLAIVKWIAEAHNGRVEVESALGQGSRFSILLPLEHDARAPTGALQFLHPALPPT